MVYTIIKYYVLHICSVNCTIYTYHEQLTFHRCCKPSCPKSFPAARLHIQVSRATDLGRTSHMNDLEMGRVVVVVVVVVDQLTLNLWQVLEHLYNFVIAGQHFALIQN